MADGEKAAKAEPDGASKMPPGESGKDSEMEEEDVYEVEKIVGMTVTKGKTLYKVRWLGYGQEWDTWEPFENLESCSDMIEKYLELQKQTKQSSIGSNTADNKVCSPEGTSSSHSSVSLEDESSSQSTQSKKERNKKKKLSTWKYVSSSDDEADTLKDKFYRDLEQGKVNVFQSGDMYSKVKGKGRSARPQSFTATSQNCTAQTAGQEAETKKKHLKKKKRNSDQVELGDKQPSKRGRRKKSDESTSSASTNISDPDSLDSLSKDKNISKIIVCSINKPVDPPVLDCNIEMSSVSPLSGVTGQENTFDLRTDLDPNESENVEGKPEIVCLLPLTVSQESGQNVMVTAADTDPDSHPTEEMMITAEKESDQDTHIGEFEEVSFCSVNTSAKSLPSPTSPCKVTPASFVTDPPPVLPANKIKNCRVMLQPLILPTKPASSFLSDSISSDGTIPAECDSSSDLSSFDTDLTLMRQSSHSAALLSGPNNSDKKGTVIQADGELITIVEAKDDEEQDEVAEKDEDEEKEEEEEEEQEEAEDFSRSLKETNMDLEEETITKEVLPQNNIAGMHSMASTGTGELEHMISSMTSVSIVPPFTQTNLEKQVQAQVTSTETKQTITPQISNESSRPIAALPIMKTDPCDTTSTLMTSVVPGTSPAPISTLPLAIHTVSNTEPVYCGAPKDFGTVPPIKGILGDPRLRHGTALPPSVPNPSPAVSAAVTSGISTLSTTSICAPAVTAITSKATSSDRDVWSSFSGVSDKNIDLCKRRAENADGAHLSKKNRSIDKTREEIKDPAFKVTDYKALFSKQQKPSELPKVESTVHNVMTKNNNVPVGDGFEEFDFDLRDLDPHEWEGKIPNLQPLPLPDVIELNNAELRHSVKVNDYDRVTRALKLGRKNDLDQPDHMGVTLVMIAAQNGYDDLLELLVMRGADVNSESKSGTTALMAAAEQGLLCTVKLLMVMGAYFNTATLAGDTALSKAAQRGHKFTVKLLLEHGANFASPLSTDNTALKLAKQHNHRDVEDLLRNHIARVTGEFERQVQLTINNTANINCALFPVHCLALKETNKFKVIFKHELQSTQPGVGTLLFIAHARISASEVRCRFYGPCAVTTAYLNGVQLHPLTEEGNFVMSFSPLHNGRNELEIQTVSTPTSKAKLVICAYNAQLL